jgi:hypothetical protein
MDVRLLYNQLLEEIHAEELALEEKREAVRFLKKRIGDEVARDIPTFKPDASQTAVVAPLRTTPVIQKTLIQSVAGIVPSMKGREFVVGDVAEGLRGLGIQLTGKPNTSISTTLKRLEKSGVIVRTFTGAGNVPNRYRLADDLPQGRFDDLA